MIQWEYKPSFSFFWKKFCCQINVKADSYERVKI